MLDYTGRCAQTHTHKDQSLEAHAATSAYTHTERQIPTLIDLPVSSDLPLVSLKELEWLPACLYFLNLSMTRQALQHTSTNRHTHIYIHIHSPQIHCRMSVGCCHSNSCNLGPLHRLHKEPNKCFLGFPAFMLFSPHDQRCYNPSA